MGIAERIAAARAFDRSRFCAFDLDGRRIGYVRRDLAMHLRRFPDIFILDDATVTLAAQLSDCEARSAALAGVAESLHGEGLLTPWRDETYDIGMGADARCLFRLERAAVRFFGLMAHAVHVNGLVSRAGNICMWIARRSDAKAIDPGMLDNMVGGGLASGLSIERTLVKEAWEEAGIPKALAVCAKPQGSLWILREVPEGLHAETIYLHDLVLPAELSPANQDGEVSAWRLAALEQVAAELEGGARFTVDAALVAMDCLVRHGALGAEWGARIRAPIFSNPDWRS